MQWRGQRMPAWKPHPDALSRLGRRIVDANGKVDLPAWLSDTKIKIGKSIYQMGIGGLHSTESNRSVRSNATHVLVDADVASQYPSIIMSLGLAPKSLGTTFLDVYGQIKIDRLKAKKRAKEIKVEIAKLEKQLKEIEGDNG